jgi:DNA-binding MarR family transcriptional regulator
MDHLTELGRLGSLRDPLSRMIDLEIELTPPQIHTMMWLGVDGALPMATLAARVGCTGPTATGVIDRLDALGFVARVPKPGDRRVVLVELTPKGAQVAAQLREVMEQRFGFVLGLLEAADRKSLIDLIGKVVESLRGLTAGEDAQ